MPDPQSLRRWDVICRVVDHYGDAGVCLRLARGLAALTGREVRLLVDRPQVVLDLIRPQPLPERDAAHQPVEAAGEPALASSSPPGNTPGTTWLDRSGVRICGWDAPPRAADVVLETFGSNIPAALLEDMRARKAAGQVVPVWLNLDHLSAEAWVEGCHGLPSPQAGGLTRWFLFPGFTGRTAGLAGPPRHLPDLPADLAALLHGTAATKPAGRSVAHGGQPSAGRPLVASAFCYRDSPLPALLDAMQDGPREVRVAIPVGMPGGLGGRALDDVPGSVWHDGRLTMVRIPFVDQDLYDSVLAACDLNLVRGEDSFVRAQWMGRPLLWAAYRQPGDAHLDKVAAWLERCDMPPAWASLHGWFNGGMSGSASLPGRLWNEAVAQIGDAEHWAAGWRETLLALPRVETALAEFALGHASQIQ